MYLSWVIPARNEENRIEKTLREVDDYLRSKKLPGEYEIIVVNSASKDRTADIVEEISREIPRVRLMSLENKGKGWAVKNGMLAAKGAIRCFADADNSVSPNQSDLFISNVCTDAGPACADIVIGSIEVPGATVEEKAQWYRRALGRAAKLVIRIVSGLWEVHDSQRGFKFFSERAATTIFPKQTLVGWGFDFEVLLIGKRNGFSIRELPVVWINPPDSKVKLSAYFTTLLELLRIKWNDVRGLYTQ